jgi:hypothetical protein
MALKSPAQTGTGTGCRPRRASKGCRAPAGRCCISAAPAAGDR